jgi:F5/8 type C domain
LGKLQYIYEWISTRRCALNLILMIILILSPLGYSINLSAFPSLKPSSIDNKYDIPIGIPIETGTRDLSLNTRGNLQNLTSSLESLPEELPLLENSVSTLATCEELPVTTVTANGNDGNVPSNLIDNNLNTRWSNLGSGSWIQLDLGSMKSICSVDVNWYRGDIRQNNFVISVSNDGTTFTNKFAGTSNLGTTAEKYSLPAGTEGRYVRITVNGNTENQWASVTEVAVNGLEQASSGPIILKKQTAPGSNTWTPYKSLGGNFQSDPSVIRNTDNTLQVFAVSATNGELLYKKQTAPGSNTWTPYKSLGGNFKGNAEVAINSDNTLQVFAVSATNGELLYKKQTAPGSNTWTPYKSLGGNFQSDPSVIRNTDNTLQVFAVSATNGELLYKKQTAPGSNTWTPYKSLGGNFQSDPSVIRNTDNTLQVFAVSATNGELLYKKQTAPGSNTWTPYKSLGGNIQSDPSVTLSNAGRLESFQVGAGATSPPPPPPTGTSFPYAFVGSPEDMEDEGWGTRHYASGKPDDITHEWSGETSAQNYAIIIDITLTEIDHDDHISFKFGGTHMGSGWYDNTYAFESGEACIGKEEDHPSTDLCVVTGNSIGNLVDTPVKLAAVNIGKGEKLEMYSNLGSGWIKDVESSNGVDGFRPLVDEDEVVIRIDAAPGIIMRSAQIVEINPASAGITTTNTAPTPTPTSFDEMRNNLILNKDEYGNEVRPQMDTYNPQLNLTNLGT